MKGAIIFIIVVFLVLAYFLIKRKGEKVLKDKFDDNKSTNDDEGMTPEERGKRYELKRRNFQQNTLQYFNFLVEEFGYNPPEHKYNEQDNGTITKDEFRYTNEKFDRLIVVSNSYHPYDYGFDVCIYRPSISIAYSDDSNVRFMAIDVDKEKQDFEQTYIQKAATDFKEGFLPQIKGEVWTGEYRNDS
jgi:hypothetical protein